MDEQNKFYLQERELQKDKVTSLRRVFQNLCSANPAVTHLRLARCF